MAVALAGFWFTETSLRCQGHRRNGCISLTRSGPRPPASSPSCQLGPTASIARNRANGRQLGPPAFTKEASKVTNGPGSSIAAKWPTCRHFGPALQIVVPFGRHGANAAVIRAWFAPAGPGLRNHAWMVVQIFENVRVNGGAEWFDRAHRRSSSGPLRKNSSDSSAIRPLMVIDILRWNEPRYRSRRKVSPWVTA